MRERENGKAAEMARELEGLPSKDNAIEAVPTAVHDYAASFFRLSRLEI